MALEPIGAPSQPDFREGLERHRRDLAEEVLRTPPDRGLAAQAGHEEERRVDVQEAVVAHASVSVADQLTKRARLAQGLEQAAEPRAALLESLLAPQQPLGLGDQFLVGGGQFLVECVLLSQQLVALGLCALALGEVCDEREVVERAAAGVAGEVHEQLHRDAGSVLV